MTTTSWASRRRGERPEYGKAAGYVYKGVLNEVGLCHSEPRAQAFQFLLHRAGTVRGSRPREWTKR